MQRFTLACIAWVTSFAAPAWAQQQALPPRHKLYYVSTTGARINPLGIEQRLDLGYRYRLYSRPGLLWRDCFASIAFTPRVNPAQSRIGATLTLKPIALLSLGVNYHFIGYYGTFNYLQSFQSPWDEHSGTALSEGGDAGLNYGAIGSELQLTAQLAGKLGPFVLRNTLRAFFGDLKLRDGDDLHYHFVLDTLVRNRGWALANDTDLLFLTNFGLVAGVRAAVVHPFYKDSDFDPGESTDNPNGPIVRAGPLLAYSFFDRPGGSKFNRPTLLLILNWHIKHRYRTGADVSAAIPYTIIAFKFEGDLWSAK